MRRLHSLVLAAPLVLALAACGFNGSGRDSDAPGKTAEKSADAGQIAADPMASHDPSGNAPLDPAVADDKPRPLMQAQVVLDRLGFAPGVIDGKEGLSTRNAIEGFQKAQRPRADRQARRADACRAGPLVEYPGDPGGDDPRELRRRPVLHDAGQTRRPGEDDHAVVRIARREAGRAVPHHRRGARGTEPVARRRGATPSATPTPTPSPTATSSGATFTPQPGPPSKFRAGQQIRVPNIGGDAIDAAAVSDRDWLLTLATLGVGTGQPKADKIVVDKSEGTLQAFDAARQAGRAVHRDDGIDQRSAAAGRLEDPRQVLQSRSSTTTPSCSGMPRRPTRRPSCRRGRTGRSGWCGSTCRRSITASTARPIPRRSAAPKATAASG